MIELLATAWLNECGFANGRNFVSYSNEAWQDDCGDVHAIIHPSSSRYERKACGYVRHNSFVVEVCRSVAANDKLASVNVAHSRDDEDALLEILEGWFPGQGFGQVKAVSGGPAAPQGKYACWRYAFEVSRTCSPQISDDKKSQWQRMLSDEGS